MIEPKEFFETLFDTAVRAADPETIIPNYLPNKPKGRTVVVGAGKGAAQMAAALEKAWSKTGNGELEGAIVTRYGFGAKTSNIEVIEASHPVPDEAGLKGAKSLLEMVSTLTGDDLVIALIAGGGSALLPLPPETISLQDKILMNEVLSSSGAPIFVMNTIRKHVSQIKGGRLALAAYPARVVGLLVSDIPGDHLSHIASGPSVADETSVEDALSAIRQYDMKMPASIIQHLNTESAKAPKPDNPKFKNVTNHLIASAAISLEAVKAKAGEFGIEAVILSDAMEGEASEVAKVHGAMVRQILLKNEPFKKPVLLISGGECTVTLKNKKGVGGPNTEFALSLGIELADIDGWSALCADTDGIDGAGDNAGAFVDGNSVGKMRQVGIDAKSLLAQNESYKAFKSMNGLFKPGPTGTNVNDIRSILVTG